MDHHEIRAMYAALTFYKRRWTLEILAALAERPRRFVDLQRKVQAPYPTPFSDAMQRLEDHGLVRRPGRHDNRHYTLTAKGRRVLPALQAFMGDIQWWQDPDDDQEDPETGNGA